jgi:CheY-like chemotaxis protein
MLEDALVPDPKQLAEKDDKTALGLGLAVVARIIKNMNGQLRIRSEEGKGTRFVVQFPFDLPDSEVTDDLQEESPEGSITPQPESLHSADGERTLIAPSLSRHTSDDQQSSNTVARRSSADSLTGKTSLRSYKSGSSQRSQRSDVDRLIEAIQEPHMVSRQSTGNQSPTSSRSLRPTLTKRNSLDPGDASRLRSRSLEHLEGRLNVPPPHQRNLDGRVAGEERIASSGQPLRAIRMPDEGGQSPIETTPKSGSILGEVHDEPKAIAPGPEKLTGENMRVLVAEDDPVNSRIVKKRLERLGHDVHLTVNGEECASAFGDKPRDFDVVLMDMQVSR